MSGDIFADGAAAFSKALKERDYAAALTEQHLRFARAAINALADEGYFLKAKPWPGLRTYMNLAAAHHLAAMHHSLEIGRPPTARAIIASQLLYEVADFFEVHGKPGGQVEANSNDLARFALQCGAIGHLAGLLFADIVGPHSQKAQAYDTWLEEQRLKQRKATATKTRWMAPALQYAKEVYERDPGVSDRQIARELRMKFRATFPTIPQQERLTEVVGDWRKTGELGPKRKL